ncbi:cell cycle checkpoint protein RAD17 [Rhagoletis pomonella]|uniref:cell cycle checkpoint protein RAD17 n=1 Tax=Rhagoletis pomonella TaxID=28610 RepID=UPI00178557C8|nr:cell cycle checkpoint protein RAD17 [Rhagoletis pomonella]
MKPTTRKRAWNNSAFSHQSTFETSADKEDAVNAGSCADNKNVNVNKSPTPQNLQVSTVVSKSYKTNSNWIDTFEPVKSEDVAVHPKKLTELQNWLLHCEVVRKQHPAQICLLTGPSGSGKTAAVRVLARSLKYELQEWINPVDRDLVNTLGDQTASYIGSQIENFKSFLFRSSRYKSLLGGEKRLVLVEDFPNLILSSAETLESILDEFSKFGKSPLIFIVTDSKTRSLNISYNIFTEQLKNKFHINHISFNPIALTLLQKAMKRFCTLMKEPQIVDIYKVPSQNVIDSIIFAAQGDIRNALINLHFGSLKGTTTLPTERVESGDNKGKSKKQVSKLKTIWRDESVTMMHALGRVFNPKRLPNGNFVHTPEDISETFASEPKRFIDLIHANYLPHFADIEHVIEAANMLSISDNIITEYREETLAPTALNVAVRSMMVSNKTPVSVWMPIRAPKRQQDALCKAQQIPSVSKNLYATDFNGYVQIIKGPGNIYHPEQAIKNT